MGSARRCSNPLVFDNRFGPDPMARYPRSRVVASIVAPPRQRAQVERLAESPHTFRVVVLDKRDPAEKTLAAYSEPGTITLVTALDVYKVGGLAAGANLFSAFTYLHRLGDQLVAFGVNVVLAGQPETGVLYTFSENQPSRYLPANRPSPETMRLAERLAETWDFRFEGVSLSQMWQYVTTHTNSDMSRRGMVPASEGGYDQCVADWFALSELPAARARRGRGEPWLLFPPRPGEYGPEVERVLARYADTINEYFPAFAQSLFDDLDGAVYRI